MDDLISRQAAIDAIDAILPVEPMKNEYTQGITCGAALAIEYVKQLPSAQPEHLVKESGNLVNGLVNDCISRQAAIDAVLDRMNVEKHGRDAKPEEIQWTLEKLPSAQPERMTNKQWVDFLSAQFDISRTSAKEMLHGMMQWKKEDNFKKMFNGGGEQNGQTNR